MINTIGNLPEKRWPWTLLFLSAFTFEAVALYFQYGMKLEPCIMCIYQRVAMFGVMFAAIPGMLLPGNVFARLSGYIGWGIGAIWGFLLAKEHVVMQSDTSPFPFFTCDTIPNFPDWLQLHTMIPGVFEPRGDCGDINWRFLDQTMPEWMVIIFAAYTAVFGIVLLARLQSKKMF